ncbi:MAG: endopeptidase La [Candidatus Dormibacteria bacterium]
MAPKKSPQRKLEDVVLEGLASAGETRSRRQARPGTATARGRRRTDAGPPVPVLPLKNTVLFPHMLVPLAVGRERSLRLLESLGGERLLAMVAQHDADVDEAGPDEVFSIGSMARIHQQLKLPDGTLQLVVQGLDRIEIERFVATEPFLQAVVRRRPDTVDDSVEVQAMASAAMGNFQKLVSLAPYLPNELVTAALNQDEPLQLAYFIATHLRLELEERQAILELPNVTRKLRRVNEVLARELEVLELGRKIQVEAEEQIGKSQREYFLREQLRAIQRELGESDEQMAEINEMRERVAEANLPAEARKEADRELSRLERVPSASPEHSVIRSYLEWLVALPWNQSTGAAEVRIAEARAILDTDHYDLEKVKERILETLAVRQLKDRRGSTALGREPILCFVGPPGVGKTSLGQSIARALGRKFVRGSLGGVHDEAEIRGHRRTYIGAMPGRVIQAMRRAGANDPVFMLDEIDKVGADWRGDPSSALLEVLDPEQNREFRDNYLDLPFDLSRVMFITTANSLDSIPPPLRDRMEVLQLPGYTQDEKQHIARRYLLPKQLEANGLRPTEMVLSDESLRLVLDEYTREAGVRNLERELATICRKAAIAIAEKSTRKVNVTPAKVRSYLGKRRFFSESAERIDRPGVATGLVWTPVGGEILFVEVALVPGEGKLRLTGQLGEVMKESGEAALSYIKENAATYEIDPAVFKSHDIHVHVPSGAVPKEGPSAGVALLSALTSVLTGRRVRDDIAMTGEITLRGRVLPIGGVKEKVLAAHRAGILTIVLPHRNEPDLDDLPSELRREMEFVLVENMSEVLEATLTPRHPARNGRVPAPNGSTSPARTARSAPPRRRAPARRPG